MKALAALVLTAHLFDLSTFLVCARFFPIEGEWNPIAGVVYETFGGGGIVAQKSIALGLVFLAYRLLPGHPWVLWLFALVGVIGGLVNTASLLTL